MPHAVGGWTGGHRHSGGGRGASGPGRIDEPARVRRQRIDLLSESLHLRLHRRRLPAIRTCGASPTTNQPSVHLVSHSAIYPTLPKAVRMRGDLRCQAGSRARAPLTLAISSGAERCP